MVWFNDGDGHYFLARSSAVGSNQVLGVVNSDTPGLGHDDEPGAKSWRTRTLSRQTRPLPDGCSFCRCRSRTNQVYVPIPAGVSTICSSKGGVDANGCIAVFKSPNDDMFQKLADRDDKRGDHH